MGAAIMERPTLTVALHTMVDQVVLESGRAIDKLSESVRSIRAAAARTGR